jgi:hypothetical protein
VNPIVDPRLSPEGELRFENAAVAYDVGGRPDGYTVRWSRFDNATDTHTAVGSDVLVDEPRVTAPAGLLADAEFVSVSIATRHQAFPQWRPVQVYFRRTPGGWRTVGLDRGLDAK